MKRYDPTRASSRVIEEKAFGLIMAMNDDQATRLFEKLLEMAKNKSKRASMFCGEQK